MGKTKNVYDNQDGTYTLKLKDTATGINGIFDPGENRVGLEIPGFGRESLKISKYYFEKFNKAGVPTHYIDSDILDATMKVKPVEMFGKGLEFVCRCRADGSFLKRYGEYITLGTPLSYFMEVTLKDDARRDPPINKDALTRLKIMTGWQYELCKNIALQATSIIENDLLNSGLILYDIKFEFGLHEGEVVLIDEISEGCMRVYRNGEKLEPFELGKYILDKIF
jgi:phosphoribosylaminoimidazole-succinocarboxamide synthase